MYSKQSRKEQIRGWGGYPTIVADVFRPERYLDLIEFIDRVKGPFLARGGSTTYGDASINADGFNIDMRRMNKMLDFDQRTGLLHCQAGVTLHDIIKTFLPRGWFLHVTPGTQFATVGGCVACDAHGKNWQSGTFGNYVRGLRIMFHDGRTVYCNENENSDIFLATLGGMGMTGIILDVFVQLKNVTSSYIDVDTIRFNNLKELFHLLEQSMRSHEYLFSWVDSLHEGTSMGRGVLQRANHCTEQDLTYEERKRIAVPCNLPTYTVNRLSVASFNNLYYMTTKKRKQSRLYLEEFFYPLDRISNWHRIYGRNGFIEYQAVVPLEGAYEAVLELLQKITKSKLGSHIAAIKPLTESQGLISFPIDGITLAVDFRCNDEIWPLLDQLDQVVVGCKGRVYLGKDARLSGTNFRTMYRNSLQKWATIREQHRTTEHFASLMFNRLLNT